MVKPIDTTKELLEDYISYSFMEGNIDENTMSILTKEAPNYIDQLNELKLLNIPPVSKSFYYKFIYKDAKGELGYTIRKINKQDNDLAIESFEKAFPDLVWRNFGEIEK